MRIGLALLLTLASTGACASSSGSAPTGLGDPNVRAKLRSMALQASSASGVASPEAILAVYSADHQAAEKIISGDIVNDHSAVYVVEVTGGHFTDNQASVPPGAAPPQGDALTLTVDAQTFRLTDFGITSAAPDLTQISSDVVNLTQ